MKPAERGLAFDCEGERLMGVLSLPAGAGADADEEAGVDTDATARAAALGVVIAVGGPQYRAGSHRQFVLMARRLAAAGHAVLRFDCRGMGDSSGEFPGFEALGADLAAAAAALREHVPSVEGVVLWGLCDAASAALLNAGAAPAWAGLVLLNPWVRHADTHARTQVKHYYAQRLFEPAFWRKLAGGDVRVGQAARELGGKLWRMLHSYLRPYLPAPPGPSPTASDTSAAALDYRERMARGALAFEAPQLYILSGRDHVCAEFLEYAGSHRRLPQLWARPAVERLDLPAADHTFSSSALRRDVEDATLAFVQRVGSRGAGSAPVRILLLCDRVPSAPSDGLLLRVLNLAQDIAERRPIDLLCLRRADQPFTLPPGLFGRAWSAPPAAPPLPAGWRSPFVGWSPHTLYAASPELAALLAHTLDPADYDVIWDAGASLLTLLPPRWAGVPVVADLVDDMVLTFRRAMRRTEGLAARLRLWKYAHVHGRYAAVGMRRAAHCVVVGEEDAASFGRHSPRVPVSVIANGVDTAYYAPRTAPPLRGRLAFEGTMGFPPNALAALHLVHEVMPRIWAARPDATLALVGRDPPPALRALAGARVSVTGAVDDVRAHVGAAEVFVCPLVSGAGIKNKLLQAWAMALPVVATPLSIGGLGARDGVDLLVRDSPAAFADAVLELLADPARRAALGTAGRAVACSRFAWPAMAQAFEALLADAAGAAAG